MQHEDEDEEEDNGASFISPLPKNITQRDPGNAACAARVHFLHAAGDSVCNQQLDYAGRDSFEHQ